MKKALITYNFYNLFLFLACVLAFLESQRFLLPNLVGYVCLLTLILAFLIKNKEINLSLIILSLFLYEGITVLESNTSTLLAKYALAIVLFFIFTRYLSFSKINIGRLTIFLIFIIIISVNTFLKTNYLDLVYFINTKYFLFLIVFLFFITCTNINTNTNENLSINLPFLVYPIFFYILGELLNVFYYQELWRHELSGYLSYSSLKSMIMIPFIYSLIYKKNFFLIIFLFISTNIVIVCYASRTLFISLYLFLSLYILFRIRINFLFKFFLFFISILTLYLLSKYLSDGYKSIALLKLIFDLPITELFTFNFFYELDKVRFMEHKLFFSQNIISILFGNGVTSGLYDVNNYLGFVTFDQTAFSDEEIITKIFYNFHDPWIDISLRIGLVPFSIILLKFLFNFYFFLKNSDKKNCFLINCVFVFLINAWFLAIGLIIIFLFYKSLTNNSSGKI